MPCLCALAIAYLSLGHALPMHANLACLSINLALACTRTSAMPCPYMLPLLASALPYIGHAFHWPLHFPHALALPQPWPCPFMLAFPTCCLSLGSLLFSKGFFTSSKPLSVTFIFYNSTTHFCWCLLVFGPSSCIDLQEILVSSKDYSPCQSFYSCNRVSL